MHSPFATHLNDAAAVERNRDALFLQATLTVHGVDTRLILSADDRGATPTNRTRDNLRVIFCFTLINTPFWCQKWLRGKVADRSKDRVIFKKLNNARAIQHER